MNRADRDRPVGLPPLIRVIPAVTWFSEIKLRPWGLLTGHQRGLQRLWHKDRELVTLRIVIR
jgi:hypothetical protein